MTLNQVARSRPLPGVRFETAPTARSGLLPRLDVTGFVGYAQAGPIDTPVLVQDPVRFREVFGGDVVLADGVENAGGDPPATSRDVDRRVCGLLGPTVQAFFDNGGHSCWVVRVGVGATTGRFSVPGLVRVGPPGSPLDLRPVTLQARSPGAFCDGHAVEACVHRRPVPVLPGSLRLGGWVDGQVAVPGSVPLAPGDLLEFVVASGRTLWVPVRGVRTDEAGRRVVSWPASEETWLEPVRDAAATGPFTGRVVGPDRDETVQVESFVAGADGTISLVVPVTPDRAPRIGEVVVVPDVAASPVVVTVGAPAQGESGAGPVTSVVTGWPAWRLFPTSAARAAAPASLALDRAGVLELGLATRYGDALGATVEGLGLTSDHPRWFGLLPSDGELFGRTYRELATGSPAGEAGPLDPQVAHPRFALAATGGPPGLYLPLGLGAAYGVSAAGDVITGPGDVRARNGVAQRQAAAFVDPDLAGLGPETLVAEARRRFFVESRPLRGVHALMPLEDVAVVAAPDAGHGEWRLSSPDPSPVVLGPDLRLRADSNELDWFDPFQDVDDSAPADGFVLESSPEPDFPGGVETTTYGGEVWRTPVVRGRCGPAFLRVRALRRGVTSPWSNTVLVAAERGPFDQCDARLLVAPQPTLAGLLLSWTAAAGPPYEVQQSPHPLFARDVASVVTTQTHHSLSRAATGVTYARVRSAAGPWSITLALAAPPAGRWLVTHPGPHDPDGGVSEPAVAVHRELAVLAAARRDLTVLLSFPQWYGGEAVELHLGRVAEAPAAGLDRLHAHHPWVLTTTGTATGPRPLPADGAVAGRMARGSLERGPWIATAATPLAEVLGVAADRPDADPLRLRAAQVNAPRRTRRGVELTGVDTLATDPLVRPVTVRRLLILVQRLALREGRELVFEPNGPDLRRLLQTRFEAALGLMFRLGAFAGTTPAQAYRVLCDEGLNPPRVSDAGQVVVELQIAPSHPLEFVVVRLVQTGTDGLRLAALDGIEGVA